ncbi:MAG: adenylosuccinate synthase [Pseudomonadota bacterium]
MPAVVIVGAQWGDEGKGKITDVLAHDADVVVRYQGGNNAGHTIVVGPETYKFHLIPSGMLYQQKLCVLGNGVVVDPEELIAELDGLEHKGVDTARLKVSSRAHYILPTHRELDQRSEEKKGSSKIGTTGRGIGPAYRDKVIRSGIRVGDPIDPVHLTEQLGRHLDEHAADLGATTWTAASLARHLLDMYARLRPHICDSVALVNGRLDQGQRVLFEGAQGTLLDVDHGTYPFVTSSSPTAGGACIGAGVGPTRIGAVVGVTKAYTTRVGSGPFPTELEDAVGERLRAAGNEFGTTTGRPRRCGWLDLVALRYAVQVNGLTQLAITKLDVLDGFDTLKVCVGYRIDGKDYAGFPASVRQLDQVEPVYEEHPGWSQPSTGARAWSELPANAITYISRIEEFLRTPVAIVSVGADRDATFSRLAIWESAGR